MKRFLTGILTSVMLIMLAGCTPSTIQESTAPIPEGVTIPENLAGTMEMPESTAYVIPEGAEGPGQMAETASLDYSYYPDDKQPTETDDSGTELVILYVPQSGGIVARFDEVETKDAESLMTALIDNNAVTDDVTVGSFEISEDGHSASLTVSAATSVYQAAPEREVVTAIANTFIDGFQLDTISVTVSSSGNVYTDLSFSQEYDASKRATSAAESESETTGSTETTDATD